MSELSTYARPYAKAVYELAKEQGTLDQWSDFLRSFAQTLSVQSVNALIGDPRVDEEQLAELLTELIGKNPSDEQRNLIRLLVQNDRLQAANDLVAIFEHMRNQDKGLIEAEVISAQELTDTQQSDLKTFLKKRLGAEVTLHTKLEKDLLGGVVIHAKDLVIDGSLKGRLEQLARTMSH